MALLHCIYDCGSLAFVMIPHQLFEFFYFSFRIRDAGRGAIDNRYWDLSGLKDFHATVICALHVTYKIEHRLKKNEQISSTTKKKKCVCSVFVPLEMLRSLRIRSRMVSTR